MMKAMLATNLDVPAVKLCGDDNWVVEQKFDGRRLIVETVWEGDVPVVAGFARSGLRTDVPDGVASTVAMFGEDCVLDGELVGSLYYVFDILSFRGNDLTQGSFGMRRSFLETLFDGMNDFWFVDLVEQCSVRKAEWVNAHRDAGSEGVVWKRLDSKYVEGRSRFWLKQKFVKQADVVIMAKGEDKDNFLYGFWDGDGLVPVGKVSALTGDGPDVEVGDVVTVTYLYVSDSGKLVQPVTPMLRDDKSPEECTFNQIKQFERAY